MLSVVIKMKNRLEQRSPSIERKYWYFLSIDGEKILVFYRRIPIFSVEYQYFSRENIGILQINRHYLRLLCFINNKTKVILRNCDLDSRTVLEREE